MRLLEMWSPIVNERSGARGIGLNQCWTRLKAGDGIANKLDKFLAAQKSCKQMQETAREIARGTAFSSKAASCGAFAYDKDSHQHVCGCYKGTGSEAGVCNALNCYNDREDA